jgi:hypothetical protein
MPNTYDLFWRREREQNQSLNTLLINYLKVANFITPRITIKSQSFDKNLLTRVKIDNELEEDWELQGRNQLYLSKAIDGERYFLGTHNPVVRNLVALVRSLLIN